MSAPGFRALEEPTTGRRVLRARAACGLDVWVAPMPGYRKAYAAVTTRFGSIDTQLPDGTPLPDGIAHFLEHKMFQTEAGDVFELYEARGASANAFTTYTHTTYLFASTDGFAENLDTLLETMAGITTTTEGIEREKGIIGQELAGYDDDPSWQAWIGLLQALYSRHPVRIDIGGTAETIAPIDAAILRRTHAAYYDAANLVLTVAGDVEPAAVLAAVDRAFGTGSAGARHGRAPAGEPAAVASAEVRRRMPVGRPHVWLGLKDDAVADPGARVRRRLHTAMLVRMLFGDGGLVQAPLYEAGRVDGSFGGGYEAEEDYAYAWVGAEVDAVDAFQDQLGAALEAAREAGIDAQRLERCRRQFLGRHLRVFNTPEGCASWMQGLALDDVEPGVVQAALQEATVEGMNARLRELLDAPRAWSILDPLDRNVQTSA